MDKNNTIDMAQIPYIEHCRRIFKAQQRERFLMMLLVGSNLAWIIGLVLGLITR